MKLYDKIVGLNKVEAYELYVRIVHKPKKYERVTRKQMAEGIVETFLSENHLYHFINARGLMCLYVLLNNKDNSVIDDYHLMLYRLQKELILTEELEVYEELQDTINDLFNEFDYESYSQEHVLLVDLIIGLLNRLFRVPLKVFLKLACQLFEKEEEVIASYLSHPRFRFYAYYRYDEETDDDVVYFNYSFYLNELINQCVKDNSKSLNSAFSFQQLASYAYNGFDASFEAGEKLLAILNNNYSDALYDGVMNGLYTGDFGSVASLLETKKPEVKDAIMELIFDIPTPAYVGVSYNEYQSVLDKENKAMLGLPRTRQVNACLSNEDSDLFYKLYFALLEYTNKSYKIAPGLKIYKSLHVNPLDLRNIDYKLWDNAKFIIKNFVRENPFKFTKEELKLVEEFKKCTKKAVFILAGFTEDHTLFIDGEDKLYKVKGIRCNIDQIVDNNRIPAAYETTLLMFKGNLIYSSVLGDITVDLPVEIVEKTVELVKNGNYITKLK